MTPSSSCDDVSCDSLRSLMGARHRARLCTDSTSSLSARATRYGQEQGRMLGDSCAESAHNAQRSSLRSTLVQSRACHARDSACHVRALWMLGKHDRSLHDRSLHWSEDHRGCPRRRRRRRLTRPGRRSSDEPVTDARNGRKRRAGECVRIYRARSTHRLRRSRLMIYVVIVCVIIVTGKCVREKKKKKLSPHG